MAETAQDRIQVYIIKYTEIYKKQPREAWSRGLA